MPLATGLAAAALLGLLTLLATARHGRRRPRSDDEHPESLTTVLGPGDEEYLAWLADHHWPRDEYLDLEHDWLQPGEVNVGYYLFPAARGKGYASRAVELLLLQLSRATPHTVATLVIDPENDSSLRLARRLGFVEKGEFEKGLFFTRRL